MEWGSGSIKDVVINNFYYYITTIIDEKGAGFALLILGVFLMVMTFFKTAATYLSLLFHDTASVGNRARYSQLCV